MFNKAEYDMEYMKEHYKRIALTLKNDHYARVKDYAGSNGIAVNTLIRNALDEFMTNHPDGTAAEKEELEKITKKETCTMITEYHVENSTNIWDNITRVCGERGTTPTAMLLRLKISTGNIAAWKTGGNIGSNRLLAIAEYLHCSADRLLRGHDYVPEEDEASEKEGTFAVDDRERAVIEMYRLMGDDIKDFIFASMKNAVKKV